MQLSTCINVCLQFICSIFFCFFCISLLPFLSSKEMPRWFAFILYSPHFGCNLGDHLSVIMLLWKTFFYLYRNLHDFAIDILKLNTFCKRIFSTLLETILAIRLQPNKWWASVIDRFPRASSYTRCTCRFSPLYMINHISSGDCNLQRNCMMQWWITRKGNIECPLHYTGSSKNATIRVINSIKVLYIIQFAMKWNALWSVATPRELTLRWVRSVKNCFVSRDCSKPRSMIGKSLEAVACILRWDEDYYGFNQIHQ